MTRVEVGAALTGRLRRAALTLALAALAAGGPAYAQDDEDVMPGFDVESDEPVRIESDSLEVRDRDQVAIFTGNVIARQGETTLRTKTLTVHYAGSADVENGGATDTQSIERLEAEGRVVVEREDQKATGERATFEVESQIITLEGDVTLARGDNVVRGAKLVANLETGVSHLEPEEGTERAGRVQGLFIPGQMRQEQDQGQAESD